MNVRIWFTRILWAVGCISLELYFTHQQEAFLLWLTVFGLSGALFSILEGIYMGDRS